MSKGKKKRPPFFWSILVLSLFALFSIATALFFYFTQQQFVNKALKAEGRIIRYEKQRKVYRPVLTFTTQKKDTITFTASLGKPDTTAIPKGKILNLLYLPDNPKIVKVNEFWQLWFQPFVIAGFGTGPLLFILFLRWVLVPKRSRKNTEEEA
ncbi:MAG TPA: hypothetical protein DCS93_23700 [Microscillaceae bacterium]|nr:hypothetical protein [Microscillaceae bacterium]